MERLRRLRTERGLSQAKLAARAELDPSTVNQIERGAREASPATLRKLADALDVGIADLLEDVSPKAQSRSSLEPSFNDVLADERHIEILDNVRGAVLEEMQREHQAIERTLESGQPQSRFPRFHEISERLALEHSASELAALLVLLMHTESASEPISTLREQIEEAYHGSAEYRERKARGEARVRGDASR